MDDRKLGPLVRRIASGDEAALSSFYDALQSVVFGFARQVLADEGAAEEATLDVFSQVWREAKRFDAARGSVVAWVMNLARSRAIDRMRMAGGAARRLEKPFPADRSLDPPNEGPAPAEVSSLAERRERVASAIAGLPEDQQQAIRCAFLLGMSHSEVAVHLKQPLGTIKTRIRTGLQRLRETLLPLEASA